MDRSKFLKIAMSQAAADYGIDISAFDGGAHLFEAKPFGAHAIKTKKGKPFLDMLYFGNGLVAVADERMIDFMDEYIKRCGQNLFRAFDAPNLFELSDKLSQYGYTVGEMAHGFLPSVSTKRLENVKSDECVILRGAEIAELYRYKEFGEALCYSTVDERKDVIAVAYYNGMRPVAVAACSNDGEEMYQIGVDVLPEYRRRGSGTLLVKRLTELIIESGKCPYYRCAWSNIPSRRSAEACGYSEAWVELSCVPKSRF